MLKCNSDLFQFIAAICFHTSVLHTFLVTPLLPFCTIYFIFCLFSLYLTTEEMLLHLDVAIICRQRLFVSFITLLIHSAYNELLTRHSLVDLCFLLQSAIYLQNFCPLNVVFDWSWSNVSINALRVPV